MMRGIVGEIEKFLQRVYASVSWVNHFACTCAQQHGTVEPLTAESTKFSQAKRALKISLNNHNNLLIQNYHLGGMKKPSSEWGTKLTSHI